MLSSGAVSEVSARINRREDAPRDPRMYSVSARAAFLSDCLISIHNSDT